MTNKKAPVSPPASVVSTGPARPEILDADRLVLSLVADLPRLKAFQPLVKNVAALNSYHRLGINIAQALNHLETADIKVATILPGIKAMLTAADAEALAMAKEFEELTGYPMNPKSLDSASALDTELKEQSAEKRKAFDLRARVFNIRKSIYDEERPRGKVEELIAVARETAKQIIFEQPKNSVSNDLPGWKTPPKLDEKNPVVAKLLKQLTLFEETRAALGSGPATTEQLRNVGFSDSRIRDILDAADGLANEQIVQSETIERLAPEQRSPFVARAAKIASVRMIAEEAQSYLDSATAGKK